MPSNPSSVFIAASRCALGVISLGIAASAQASAVIEYQKLLAGDGMTPDQYGASVDTHNEYMIVGAKYGDFDFILDCGAAYIWKRTATSEWEEDAKLNAPDAESSDVFGISTALGNDIAIVGAYHEDVDSGVNDRAGSAYIFRRDMGGVWSFDEKLTAPSRLPGERFGSTISMDGDDAVLIGASGLPIGLPAAGSAYLFEEDMTGDFIFQHRFVATDTAIGDHFGDSVALQGDTAVVGAWENDSRMGAIYVFTRDSMTGVWDSGTKVTPDVRVANERFGWSVAFDGATIVVGATEEGTTNTGAAYLFESDGGGGWTQTARIVGAQATSRHQFGKAVAISGDHAFIGSDEIGLFPNPGDNGSVYIYRRGAGNTWTQIDRVLAADGQPDDQLGAAIAIDQGLLIAGALTEDEFGFSAGAAYVFDVHGVVCPADINQDFVIDTADLGLLIAAFGSADTASDLNDDGVVDTADLGVLIAAFGSDCD